LIAGLGLSIPGKPSSLVSVVDIHGLPGRRQTKAVRAASQAAGISAPGPRPTPRPKPKDEPAPSDQPSQAGNPALGSAFLADLRRAIEREKRYPVLARTRRQEGTAELAFTLHKDGTIADVAVARSSGFRELDEAGARTLSGLGRFKPVPDTVSIGDLRLVVPIEFRLEV
jgi:protein TonB